MFTPKLKLLLVLLIPIGAASAAGVYYVTIGDFAKVTTPMTYPPSRTTTSAAYSTTHTTNSITPMTQGQITSVSPNGTPNATETIMFRGIGDSFAGGGHYYYFHLTNAGTASIKLARYAGQSCSGSMTFESQPSPVLLSSVPTDILIPDTCQLGELDIWTVYGNMFSFTIYYQNPYTFHLPLPIYGFGPTSETWLSKNGGYTGNSVVFTFANTGNGTVAIAEYWTSAVGINGNYDYSNSSATAWAWNSGAVSFSVAPGQSVQLTFRNAPDPSIGGFTAHVLIPVPNAKPADLAYIINT